MTIVIAEVVSPPSTQNLRTQVRVIPHMNEIQETELLPWYPAFFKNSVLFAREGEYVWALANDDYTIGFILGFVNSFTWLGDFENESIPEALRNSIDTAYVELRGRVLNYGSLDIKHWDDNSLHFIDRSDSSYTIAFRNGTVHRVAPDIVEHKVGSSSVTIRDGSIVLDADRIYLAGLVRLGKNPKGRVLVAGGIASRDGSPSEYVEA